MPVFVMAMAVLINLSMSFFSFADDKPPSDVGRLYLILDTSASMKSNMELIQQPLAQISRTYQASFIGRKTGPENAAVWLWPFPQPIWQAIPVSGQLEAELFSLPQGGSKEDGLAAIQALLDTGVTYAHLLLVTDERRAETESLNWKDILAQAKRQQVIIHGVLGFDSRSSSRSARDSELLAYRVKGGTNIGDIEDGSDITGLDIDGQEMPITDRKLSFTARRALQSDYARLAMGSGGSVWRMSSLLAGRGIFEQTLASELAEYDNLQVLAHVSVLGVQATGNILTLDATNMVYFKEGIEVESWAWDLDDDGVADDFGPVINYRQQAALDKINLLLELNSGEQFIQPVNLGM